MLRRDAQRNLERLARAAREVFAERGLNAPLEKIAERAGVSIGTLYNRYPDRYALIDAVLLDRMQENLQIGEVALAADDPWQGFADYLEQTCELQARDRGVTDAISRRFPKAPKVEAACADGFVQARQLIERAQRQGTLRPDFTVGDLVSVLWANARIVEATIAVDPNAWRRYLRFVLDGLHAEAAHPIPEPALDPDQVDRARLALGATKQ
ncbi:MAG TPA: helix-turn-helix domain-containing protein [Streptosporangiaceae bacterium]|jgi:AcrR family transcriptional regulator